jgi:hypothetical protein
MKVLVRAHHITAAGVRTMPRSKLFAAVSSLVCPTTPLSPCSSMKTLASVPAPLYTSGQRFQLNNRQTGTMYLLWAHTSNACTCHCCSLFKEAFTGGAAVVMSGACMV